MCVCVCVHPCVYEFVRGNVYVFVYNMCFIFMQFRKYQNFSQLICS